MSGEGYTPSEEEVREAWAGQEAVRDSVRGRSAPDDEAMFTAEFNRWLASERARIWDEGFVAGDVFDVCRSMEDPPVNPYRKGGDA